MTGRKKIIFWDWTGTLADESDLDRAVCEDMERELARIRGISFEEAGSVFNRYLEGLEGTWPWHDYVRHGRALGVDWRRSQDVSLGRLRLLKGAAEILDLAHGRGYLNVLATNAVGPVVRLRAAHAGIEKRFDLIIGSDQAQALKAEGRHFALGLKLLEGEAEASFSIGDNPVQDIRPAALLGMTTVYCESGRGRTHYHSDHLTANHDETAEPGHRIRSLEEIKDII